MYTNQRCSATASLIALLYQNLCFIGRQMAAHLSLIEPEIFQRTVRARQNLCHLCHFYQKESVALCKEDNFLVNSKFNRLLPDLALLVWVWLSPIKSSNWVWQQHLHQSIKIKMLFFPHLSFYSSFEMRWEGVGGQKMNCWTLGTSVSSFSPSPELLTWLNI